MTEQGNKVISTSKINCRSIDIKGHVEKQKTQDQNKNKHATSSSHSDRLTILRIMDPQHRSVETHTTFYCHSDQLAFESWTLKKNPGKRILASENNSYRRRLQVQYNNLIGNGHAWLGLSEMWRETQRNGIDYRSQYLRICIKKNCRYTPMSHETRRVYDSKV